MFPRSASETRNLILLACLMNAILIGLAATELIPVFNGLPYDSTVYAGITREFAACTYNIKLDTYYMQRLFPCAIVGGFAKLLHFNTDRTYLIDAFRLLNLTAINITAVLMSEILRLKGITGRPRVLALIIGLGNFCVLKYALYFPVLTDSTAICIAAALLYAYYRRWPRLILALGIAGAFTHPLLLFVASALYLFPEGAPETSQTAGKAPRFAWLPYAVAAVYVLAGSILYVFAHDFVVGRTEWLLAPVNFQLYFISMAIGAAYIFMVLRMGLRLNLPARLSGELRKKRLATVVLLILAVKLFQHLRSTGPGPLNARKYGLNIVLGSLTQPGQFLVAHIAFLGPIVLFIAIMFAGFRRELAKQGTGFIAVVIFVLFLLLNSETRQCSFCLPFLIVPLATSLGKSGVSARELTVTAIITLLISKIWLPLNVGSLAALKDPAQLNQRFFLNMGPWMLWQPYLVQAVAYGVAGVVLYFLFRNRRHAISG